LIQNSQEAEKSLEDLKKVYSSTESDKEKRTSQLQGNIDELKDQIHVESKRGAQMKERIQSVVGEGQSAQETLLKQLHKKVKFVYESCGFDGTTSPSTLFMLR